MAKLQVNDPTLQDELERKVYDKLDSLYGLYQTAQITKSEFHVGLGAVYDCVSGLMSDDQSFNDLVVELQKEISDANSAITRVYKKGDSAMIISWYLGSDIVCLMSTDDYVKRERECKDAPDARSNFNQIAAKLKKAGYEWVC